MFCPEAGEQPYTRAASSHQERSDASFSEKVFQETHPPLMDGEFYHGGCGHESGPEDKPAPGAISSWRPQQVEGK